MPEQQQQQSDDNSPTVPVRDAVLTIGRALENLTDEQRARVIACAAILTGTGDRVTDILGGNA